jgi:uncharacterized protein
VRLAVRLTPRASSSAIAGVTHSAAGEASLSVRLAAPPVDGAANQALIAFLADQFRLRKRDVTILSGETSRWKMLHLSGRPDMLASKIDALARSAGETDL